MSNVRIRINLNQRELEIEGPEPFVANYTEQLTSLLRQLIDPINSQNAVIQSPSESATVEVEDSSSSFGELYHLMPRTLTDVDRILLAGYFVQRNSSTGSFTTSEVNTLLTEHGVRVSNASECVRRNISTKRVFNIKGKYRVSQHGEEYVRQLFKSAAER